MHWCSVLVGLLFLVSSGCAHQYTVEWSPSGVAAVNFSVTVEIGDRLILTCPPGSYSNLVGLGDIKQYDTCNSSSTNGNAQFRGNCIGRSRASDLILNIEEASAKLPGDFGFVEGETSYLTSFSSGIDLSSSFQDITSGGECLDGLRLILKIKDSSVTTVPVHTSTGTTTVSSVDENSPSPSPSDRQGGDGTLPSPNPLPEGLVGEVVDSSLQLHTTPVLVVMCALLTLILRTHS